MDCKELIEKLPFGHLYTTSPEHVAILAKEAQWKTLPVEIGSYLGISTAVIAFASGVKTVSIDLCDEIPSFKRRDLWNSLGVPLDIACLDMSSEDFLENWEMILVGIRPDFIFHDARHGDHIRPEYRACWDLLAPGGTLAIHDFEQVKDRAEFAGALPDLADWSETLDERGRSLGIFHKKHFEVGRSF